MDLQGRHILLALGGGIACYKSAELCRLLIKEGASVQVVMTEGAQAFITPLTLQALSGRPVVTSMWDTAQPNAMAHINLSREADAVLIAPASADTLASLSQGRADDLLSLLCLARPRERVALLIAPAMNREMWLHPATQRNLAQVAADGAVLLGVGNGPQACGETGDGRMLEPPELRDELIAFFQPKLLAGQAVLVTAGPTYEAIDPVRGITNRSSGKMGFAMARAAAEAGASVTLVAGPVDLPTPRGVNRIDVRSAQEMHDAVMAALPKRGVFVACAAVADWRPTHMSDHKIKKAEGAAPPSLSFVENPDILAAVAALPSAQSGSLYCVGFAAESQDLLSNAQAKRARKGVPLLAANIGPQTFGRDDNALLLVDEHGTRSLPQGRKLDLARQLVAEIARRITPEVT